VHFFGVAQFDLCVCLCGVELISSISTKTDDAQSSITVLDVFVEISQELVLGPKGKILDPTFLKGHFMRLSGKPAWPNCKQGPFMAMFLCTPISLSILSF
jgi:hypothetical protein